MITREKLLRDPEGCGSKYAFLLQRGIVPELKDKAVVGAPKHIANFAQVPGSCRVTQATLTVGTGRTCTVGVSAYTPATDTSASFPIYYLPWAEDQVVRVTLKPSKHQAVSREPDVFFTDNLQGCMVTVEGPPENPTVYHSNVVSFLGSPAGERGLREDLARFYIEAKVIVMEQGYKAMSAQHDKVGELNRKGLLHPKSINQHAYQSLLGRPSGEQDEKRYLEKIMADKGVKGFSDRGGIVKFEVSKGTVFGVRSYGYWHFYYQRLLCGSFFRKEETKDPLKPRLVWLYDDWRPLYCNEFWPFGEGSLTL